MVYRFTLFLTGLVDQPQSEQDSLSGPLVDVVVAERALAVRSALTLEDLSVRQIAVSAVPEGAVPDIDSVVGQVTLVDLFPGEVILAQRLADPNVTSGDGRLALILAEDEVNLVKFKSQSDLMRSTCAFHIGNTDIIAIHQFHP